MFLFPRKFPTKSQWRNFLKVLSKKEKITFFVFLFSGIGSFLFLSIDFYLKNTAVAPARGGVYIEGVIGSPRFINPIYSASSDVDRDLAELIYAGLMKYDENGQIQTDLVKDYKVLEEGRAYEFYLKENLLWQDQKPLTADDVIFTIKTIQNPSFKSPIRASWLGVNVEKISDLGVRLELKNSSAVFLENCTLKIIPEHIWQDISSQNFPLSVYNLKPVGSGPYKLKEFTQNKEGDIKSLELVSNPNYFGSPTNIPKIIFYFFNTEDELVSAFKANQIDGFSLLSFEKYGDLKNKKFESYSLSLPRYFAVFFNPEKAKVLADKKIRQALNYATDKKEVLEKALFNQGKIADSPILPAIYGLPEPKKTYEFNLETAQQLLAEAGFVENEAGIREKIIKKEPAFQFKSSLKTGSQGSEVQELQKCLAKDMAIYPEGEITGYFGEKTKTAVIKFQEKYKAEILEPQGLSAGTGDVLKSTRDKLNSLCAAPSEEKLSLSFSLTTVNQPILIKAASLLKEKWTPLGINLEIKTADIANFSEEVIRPRNYEMLLFGEVLTMVPDLYPFWHSSQIKDPGLNLAGYQSKDCDKLLEEAREATDENKRKTALEKFQDILIGDAPAIFLYSPDYLYLVSNEIKGINTSIITDPSKRFTNIGNWYIETKRVWE